MSDALKLDGQLCFAVYSAANAFNRFYRPLLAELGLTYPQYLVLLVLWERDGVTVGEIGDRLLLDSGTLSPVLRRLATQGLVEKHRDAVDERQVRVALTDVGKALKHKAETFPAAILAASQCTGAELDGLRQAVGQLRDRLDAAAS